MKHDYMVATVQTEITLQVRLKAPARCLSLSICTTAHAKLKLAN